MKNKLEKKWIDLNPNLNDAARLAEKLNLSIPTCCLLINRGLTDYESAKKFLYPRWEDLHNPFLFSDMEKAVSRIKKAIKRGEKICIYGDYDTDGTTSVSLLIKTFRYLGTEVDYFIPNRFSDGYGINTQIVEDLAARQVDLLITVDCGITAVKEIDLANRLGMDIIVTDHHLPNLGNFPEAHALITPRLKENVYPYHELAGVGLAFKLACALVPNREFLEGLLDLVALGTTVDVAPLTGENRTLTRLGLNRLNDPEQMRRPGIRALCSVANYKNGQELSGYSFSFGLGPRINAAGRMGSANRVVEMLTAESYEDALKIAVEINKANQDRKELESGIKENALSIIRRQKLDQLPAIVLSHNWGETAKGVIGIVAARIMDEFYKPVIIMTESQGVANGSGRSIQGLNLSQALTACAKHLIRYGGHAAAAGLSIETRKIDAFKKDFHAYVDENLSPVDLAPKLEVDHALDLSFVNMNYLRELALFEPFGNKNKKPKLSDASVGIARPPAVIGKDRRHLALKLESGDSTFNGIYWSGAPHQRVLGNLSYRFDLVFTPELNEYNSRKDIQIVIEDWKCNSDSKTKGVRVYPAKNVASEFKVIDSRGYAKMPYIETILKRGEQALIYVKHHKHAKFLLGELNRKFPQAGAKVDAKSDLANPELLALVATDTLFTYSPTELVDMDFPFVKHHIFCAPVTDWDKFYWNCLAALGQQETTGIHLLFGPLDRDRLENEINSSDADPFLIKTYKNFLDFQYQRDIRPIYERIWTHYHLGGRENDNS